MNILVNDANILIDLLKIDLINPFFKLQYQFVVTDYVFAEIQEDNTNHLVNLINTGILTKRTFNEEETGILFQLMNTRLPKTECQKRLRKWREITTDDSP